MWDAVAMIWNVSPASGTPSKPSTCTVLEATLERPLARIERCLQHGALSLTVGVGLQVEQLRLQQDLVEQLLHVGPRLGGDRRRERRAPELLEHHSVRQQVLLDLLHVGGRQVDL